MSAQEHHDGPGGRPEPGADEAVLLQWTVHLWRQRPERGWAVLAAAALAGGLGWWMLASPLFALLGPLLVVSATAEFVFPAHYRLTGRRAFAAYGAARLEIDWDRVQRVLVADDAVKLSPFASPNRLDAFRGVQLRFADQATRGAAMQIIRSHARSLQAHA